MRIRVNGVEITLPAAGATVYMEDSSGIEAVEMSSEDALEVLLASVRSQASKQADVDGLMYGRVWKLLDPRGDLSQHIGPGWMKEITERVVRSGVLR